MRDDWQSYRQTLAKELGDELAEEFTAGLHAQTGGSIPAAESLFYDVGRIWAPILQAWGAWIERHAEGPIALIMRDAKPLAVLPMAKSWKQLYLNRLICGVPDELSGDSAHKQHPLLRRYLKQYECAGNFTFVDTGCYGTVVLELHKLGLNFKPLFFFSKNPHIRGFLNEAGVSSSDGEILNDSLECAFPHVFERPTEMVERTDGVGVTLRPTDSLSVTLGNAALRGVQESAPSHSDEPMGNLVNRLVDLSKAARRGEFGGVLARSSPEWSKKREFLCSWPKELQWS